MHNTKRIDDRGARRRVGILTFHAYHNYGAVLQTFALMTYLRSIGLEVELINYVSENTKTSTPLWRGWGLRSGRFLYQVRCKLIRILHGRRLKAVMDRFRTEKLLGASPRLSFERLAEEASRFDCLIVGSDQIWNPAICDDDAYFLAFPGFNGIRISYAASCGGPAAYNRIRPERQEQLEKFHTITVRDQVTFEFTKRHGIDRAVRVVDPVFLPEVSAFQVRKPANLPDKYIVMFAFGGDSDAAGRSFSAAAKKALGLPLVAIISSEETPAYLPHADITLYAITPFEWTSIFSNADLVITDSFHGAAFSIRFQKQFLVLIPDPTRGHRIVDLTSRYGLDGRIVKDADQVRTVLDKKIDYQQVNASVQRDIDLSQGILKNAVLSGR